MKNGAERAEQTLLAHAQRNALKKHTNTGILACQDSINQNAEFSSACKTVLNEKDETLILFFYSLI